MASIQLGSMLRLKEIPDFTGQSHYSPSPTKSPRPPSFSASVFWKKPSKTPVPVVKNYTSYLVTSLVDGLGTDNKQRIKENSNPGPGSYDPKISCSRGISLGARRPRVESRKEGPGPGAYNPVPPNLSFTFSIGTSQRKTPSSPPIPGPGAYTPSVQKRKSYRAQRSKGFGVSQRVLFPHLPNSPGPGSYSPKHPKKTLSFGFGLKTYFPKRLTQRTNYSEVSTGDFPTKILEPLTRRQEALENQYS